MSVSAGGIGEMLKARGDSQLNCFPTTTQCSGFIGCACALSLQVAGRKADARICAWLRGCLGSAGSADLEVALAVSAVGLW